MYTLRQVYHDRTQNNVSLGSIYQFIHRDLHPEAFQRFIEGTAPHPDQENIYGVLTYADGTKTWPLYEGFKYYIMTESGKTFDNLTYLG